MGNIVKDYFGAYKISRLKGRRTDGAFLMSYFIAMPVVIGVSGNVNFRWEYIAAFIGIFLPMGLSCLDVLLRSPGLDKMLYLCPMTRDERKKYIYGIYYLGLGVHMIVALMGVGFIIPFSNCDIFSVIQILLNDFLIAILISSERGGENSLTDKEQLLQIWLIATALISNMIETAVVTDEMADKDIVVKLALFGIFVVLQLPMAIKYGGYVKQRLNDAVDYETWQRRTA